MNAFKTAALCPKVLRITRKALGLTLENVALQSGYCLRTVRSFELNPDVVSGAVRKEIIGVYEKAGAAVTIEGGWLVISVPYAADA